MGVGSLARNGIAPQIAKQVMRHSDYRATIKSYTALELDDSRQAVASLKSFASANRVDGPGFLGAPSPAGPQGQEAEGCSYVRFGATRAVCQRCCEVENALDRPI